MTTPDDFDTGLTQVAAHFRKKGTGHSAGTAAFVLRARDYIKHLDRLLNPTISERLGFSNDFDTIIKRIES